jgi:F0F1-type ATP synthase assembly protein I
MAWNAVIEFTAAVMVYGFLGWLADRWLGTDPALFLVGLFAGMLLGLYVLKKRADQMDAAAAARRAKRATR